jgi:hypothetical protein
MTAISRLWRTNRLLLVATAAALAVTVFFAARLALFLVFWSDPAHRDEAIAGWMTPRYIAYSWGVPPEVVGEALGLQPQERRGRPPTLDGLAAERGVAPSELEAQVEAAIARYRAENP